MAEPLKNMFNKELIDSLSDKISTVYSKFDKTSFLERILTENWEDKELKERMNHISGTLHDFLPEKYNEAVLILKKVSSDFDGFVHMFFPAYVEMFGLDDYDISIEALEFFTRFSSSEFAVRPFIIKYQDKMMDQMKLWAESDNHHVRRLASEGCRPRLPWAMAISAFKKDPHPILPILEKMKNDESEYVRRSVANNLNDISKDNPDLVIEIAKKWLGDTIETDKLIKHGCRTLLKQGNNEVLSFFGFTDPDHVVLSDFFAEPQVFIGESLGFSFTLRTEDDSLGKIRIEYFIYFMKNNGKQAGKIFKISESDFGGNMKAIEKKHSFRKISTRKYYEGLHGISIVVNGKKMAEGHFQLKMK